MKRYVKIGAKGKGNVNRTALISLPLSSVRRESRRSSSTSIPTDWMTFVISAADGESLPAIFKRR
jgi:hypothetical protein